MAEQWLEPEQATHPVAIGLGVGAILAGMVYAEGKLDAMRERQMRETRQATKPRSPTTARKPRVATKSVPAKATPVPQPNFLTRHGNELLAGQNATYRNQLPAGAGRFERGLHAIERFGPHQIFTEALVRPIGLTMKGAGATITAASKLSADLHAKNAGKIPTPLMSSNYAAANVVGMGYMGFGLAAAGIARGLTAHEAGASTPRAIAAGAAGVLDAAKVPLAVGSALHLVGKFAGLGTRALLARHLFMGSLAYNTGSQLVSSVRAGKTSIADLGMAAATGLGHTLFDVDSVRAGMQAWKNYKPPQPIPPPDFQHRRADFNPHTYAAANDRFKAMRTAAGEADAAKRRKGWTDAARIGSYRSRVPGGGNAPYGGQARDIA